MSKHTPGPWSVINTADIFTKLFSENAAGERSPSDDGWMIADCDMGGLSIDEVKANARLISAAPDLLEALAQARDVIAVALKSSAPDWFATDEDVASHVTISRIDHAIAKARGEA